MIQLDEHVDVLIVGSGFAGLAAAIEAAESGATVLVVEKNRSTGGNSRISDGGIAAPNTDIQVKFGYEDSKELFYKDIINSGLGLNHPELVKTLVDQARDAFQWSRDVLQVPYMDRIDIFGGHSVHRCYTAEKVTGATIIQKQLDYLDCHGVEVRRATRFEDFLLSPDGDIKGAVLSGGTSGKYHIGVGRGIVLASGGYGADIPFRMMQDPRLDSTIGTTNRRSATAETLRTTLRIGAMPVQLSSIQLGPWASPDETGYGHGPMFSEYIVFPYGLIVTPDTGKRFINELADRKRLSDAILSQGCPCIGIADEWAVSSSGWDISTAIRRNVVKKFQTIAELAESYDIPAAELAETIKGFNLAIKNREDTDFGKPIIRDADPLNTPPFYAMRLWPKVHHVSGGVAIDAGTHVLDLDGKPIPKLYAAGEFCGGIHGANRLGSCAITECLVFGRIAGRNCIQ